MISVIIRMEIKITFRDIKNIVMGKSNTALAIATINLDTKKISLHINKVFMKGINTIMINVTIWLHRKVLSKCLKRYS